MDLKKFEAVVAQYQQTEAKKRQRRDVVVTGQVVGRTNEFHKYASKHKYSGVVFA